METLENHRTEQNRAVVCAFIDALFTRGDLGAVDTYLSESFLDHDPPFGADGSREGMRQAAALFRRAFPDWHATPHFLVAEDDLVVENFSATGTHRGDILGSAPTGHTVTLRGINIFRIREGLIVERWGRLDELGLLHQLGITAAPA
ncbi:ester cyclase [Kitasatospora sp. NPDC048239]|uniref:ester cyclase n=1 Tax=Kitasatospora sp. NPDC048239 TaxID=3364046 RepID=UPI003723B973